MRYFEHRTGTKVFPFADRRSVAAFLCCDIGMSGYAGQHVVVFMGYERGLMEFQLYPA